MFEYLKISRQGAVAWIELNRPPVNALHLPLLVELRAALEAQAAADQVRAIVISGAGKAFVAGADIATFLEAGEAEVAHLIEYGQQLFDYITVLPKPVVAAINGVALGGGLELALACDFRLVAEGAKLGLPEVNLGLIPGWGGTQRLPRLIGEAKAREMLMLGGAIGAEEALALGLVHQVVPSAELVDQASAFAARLAAQAPIAVAQIKTVLATGGSAAEAAGFATCFASADGKEGVAAFLAKRPANFKGE